MNFFAMVPWSKRVTRFISIGHLAGRGAEDIRPVLRISGCIHPLSSVSHPVYETVISAVCTFDSTVILPNDTPSSRQVTVTVCCCVPPRNILRVSFLLLLLLLFFVMFEFVGNQSERIHRPRTIAISR